MTRFNSDFAVRVVPGEETPYGHFFGGPPVHEGAQFDGAPAPLHLLHCVNLQDPAVGLQLAGASWLPLYYGLRFDGCEFGYLVESDDRIRIFDHDQRYCPDEDCFPYEDYPEQFPKVPIRLEPLTPGDNALLGQVRQLEADLDFQLTGLSDEERGTLKTWRHPFTQIGGAQHLIQGESWAKCPNPDCPAYGQKGPMTVIATVWNEPAPGVFLWMDTEDWDYVEVVFEQCSECGSIHASNQTD